VWAELQQALDAISGHDVPELDGLAPEQKLLRAFDLAAVVLRDLAGQVPVAVLVDDLQWADDDSVRLLRYLVRAAGEVPLFLLLAARSEEIAEAAKALALLADMQRMGMVRRLQVPRLTQGSSPERPVNGRVA
jgi:predicted ATPase